MKMPSQIISDKTKKRIKVSIRIIILLALSACVYKASKIRNLTHLSDNDLKWVDRYKIADTTFFRSNNGDIDTMVITDVTIHNSLFPFRNPFLNFETGSDYHANSSVDFNLIGREYLYACLIILMKKETDKAPVLSWKFGNLSSLGYVNSTGMECVIGDINNSKDIVYYLHEDSTLYIKSFEWCKGIGLKSYTLRNGETFTLMSK